MTIMLVDGVHTSFHRQSTNFVGLHTSACPNSVELMLAYLSVITWALKSGIAAYNIVDHIHIK